MSKVKEIKSVRYIRINIDGHYLVLDTIRNRSKTIRQVIDKFKLISRDYIYERFNELEKLGFIEKVPTKRKERLRGHYYRLTDSGETLLLLKRMEHKSKELGFPEELKYALL